MVSRVDCTNLHLPELQKDTEIHSPKGRLRVRVVLACTWHVMQDDFSHSSVKVLFTSLWVLCEEGALEVTSAKEESPKSPVGVCPTFFMSGQRLE